ncbi:MAG TPA: hypothetical protein EYQ50_02650 [Verrucomicrobiales bacterium]|nr:hypothetical protein [Verrucomicrobiales bacterium]
MVDSTDRRHSPVGNGNCRSGTRSTSIILCLFLISSLADTEARVPSFVSQTNPALPFTDPTPTDFKRYDGENLNFRGLSGRLTLSNDIEFNDNITLSDADPEVDTAFGIQLGAGFDWRITESNSLQFNFGLGYRYWLNNNSVGSFSIAPDSSFMYKMWFKNIQLTLTDFFTVSNDAVDFGSISGQDGSPINFHRISNTVGLSANVAMIRDMSMVLGYYYTLDRSISDEFTELDRDDFTLSAALTYDLMANMSVGVSTAYTLTRYLEDLQNDGETISIGPVFTWDISPYITLSGGASYTINDFDDNGTITDQSSFDGITYFGTINHALTQKINHRLRMGKSIGVGFGTNYSENFTLQYNIDRTILTGLTLNCSFSYENIQASGNPSETSNRYLFYLGTGYNINTEWSLGIGYTFAIKGSDLADRDYKQNRFTLFSSFNF